MSQNQLAHERYLNTRFFSCLDGLRALSILAVIWVHTGVRGTDWNILGRGQIGVDLFFSISGFLITTLLIREKEQYGFISMKGFYMRRALRIFPIYYTVIIIYTVLVLVLENNTDKGDQFFDNLPYFLTYTSNLFVDNSGAVIFYFAWSLAAEEQFYMFWPTVERLFRGFRPIYAVLFILCVQGITYLFIDRDPALLDSIWVRILISIPPPILGGVALAHLLHNKASFNVLKPVLGLKWASLIYFCLFLAALEFAVPRLGVWIVMVFMVGSIIISEQNSMSWVLRWRPLAYVGTISYGMYLLHMICYNIAHRLLQFAEIHNEWVHYPVSVTLTIIAASVSFHFYEAKFLKLKSRFSRTETKKVNAEAGIQAG